MKFLFFASSCCVIDSFILYLQRFSTSFVSYSYIRDHEKWRSGWYWNLHFCKCFIFEKKIEGILPIFVRYFLNFAPNFFFSKSAWLGVLEVVGISFLKKKNCNTTEIYGNLQSMFSESNWKFCFWLFFRNQASHNFLG